MTKSAERLRKALHRFRAAENGNVLIIFTLAAVALLGFTGAAVDYSRANSDKAAMQAALDATALMLAKTASSVAPDQLTTKATEYFNSVFTRKEVSGIRITSAIQRPDHSSSSSVPAARFPPPS